MIDPLTSLSLITNIVQLVDFGLKAAAKGREFRSTGTTAEHEHMRAVAKGISDLCTKFQNDIGHAELGKLSKDAPHTQEAAPPDTSARALSKDEEGVTKLAMRTRDVAEQLSMMLEDLKIEDHGAEMLDQSETVPITGRKRKRDVASRMVKAIWKDHDLQMLRRDLTELQQQMILNLSVMQNQTMSSVLQVLGSGFSKQVAEERESHLARLEKIRPEILGQAKRIVGSADESGSVELLSKAFEKMSSQVQTMNTCQRILTTLVFDEMNCRQESILPAHASTFEWIFQNPKLGFTSWAREKDGLFWVTGKAGSGKTTLMKFLVEHPQTKDLLAQWAGDRNIIIAYHYFWNAGTTMQKSQAGLLRTLLFHMVRQCPETAVKLVPQRFQENFGIGLMPWTLAEMAKTLEAYGRQQTMGSKLCVFIDGLDEYHGEHLDLIEHLAKLSACPSIKLCISSRPWNVFRSAYYRRTDGMLAVESLTRADIQVYINDKMNGSPFFNQLKATNPEGCSKLVIEIGAKAQGVFLWVYLVVRSLLRGLNNRDNLAILRKRLSDYPETLDGYFQRMFDRIESIYRRHSSRLMLVALKSEAPLQYCAPGFLDQELDDEDYAKKLPIGRWSPTSLVEEMDASKSYLDARCADLLELTAYGICFIHRTARDFLRQRQLFAILKRQAGSEFDDGISLARLCLAKVKSLGGDGTALGSRVRELLSCEHMIKESNLPAYVQLLDDFDACGEALFRAETGPVGYFAETKDGVTLVDETNGCYNDSLLAFEVSAALCRLRDKADELEPEPELSENPYLFGMTDINSYHSMSLTDPIWTKFEDFLEFENKEQAKSKSHEDGWGILVQDHSSQEFWKRRDREIRQPVKRASDKEGGHIAKSSTC